MQKLFLEVVVMFVQVKRKPGKGLVDEITINYNVFLRFSVIGWNILILYFCQIIQNNLQWKIVNFFRNWVIPIYITIHLKEVKYVEDSSSIHVF